MICPESMFSGVLTVGAIALGLMMTGCSRQSVMQSSVQTIHSEADRSVLEGEWEYEDGVTVLLQLDDRGNGTYPYKEGRFETIRLQDHTWTGKWYQQENDREGGFVVNLSKDYAEGEGLWWYVRIGTDRAPAKKGGTFRMSKKATLTQRGVMPPSP